MHGRGAHREERFGLKNATGPLPPQVRMDKGIGRDPTKITMREPELRAASVVVITDTLSEPEIERVYEH